MKNPFKKLKSLFYDVVLRMYIKSTIQKRKGLKQVMKNNSDTFCSVLAGMPGTGKSYFIKNYLLPFLIKEKIKTSLFHISNEEESYSLESEFLKKYSLNSRIVEGFPIQNALDDLRNNNVVIIDDAMFVIKNDLEKYLTMMMDVMSVNGNTSYLIFTSQADYNNSIYDSDVFKKVLKQTEYFFFKNGELFYYN